MLLDFRVIGVGSSLGLWIAGCAPDFVFFLVDSSEADFSDEEGCSDVEEDCAVPLSAVLLDLGALRPTFGFAASDFWWPDWLSP